MKRAKKSDIADKASGYKSAVSEIILSQTIPVENPCIRIRDQFTSQKSAVAQPTQKVSLPWGGAGVQPVLPITQAMVAITRDPLHAFFYSDNFTIGAAASYNWANRNSVAGPQGFVAQSGVDTLLDPFMATFSTGKAFHGNNLYAWQLSGNPNVKYMQCDAPPGNASAAVSKIVVSTTTAGVLAADSFTVNVYSYSGGIDQPVGNPIVKTGSGGAQVIATITVPGTDLYRIVVNYVGSGANAQANAFITVQQTWACGTLCCNPLPGLTLTKASQVSAIRICGASVKITNETADQFKTGSVSALQFPAGDHPLRVYNAPLATTTPYDFLNGQRSAFEQGFNNGYYGFLKYAEESDTNYLNPFVFDSTGTAINGATVAPLVAPYLAIMISALDSTGNGRGQVTMTFNYNVEYLTTDSWTSIDIAKAEPEEFEDANIVISSMQQHYENPLHWSKIFSTIGRYAGVAGRILGLIPHPYAQVASKAAGIASNTANAVSEL